MRDGWKTIEWMDEDEVDRTRRRGRLKWDFGGPRRGRACVRVCRMKSIRRVVGHRREIKRRGGRGGQGVDLL